MRCCVRYAYGMNELTFIGNTADANSLPWLREWQQQSHSDAPSLVLSIKHAEKGFLLYTSEYKAYIWKGSKLYDALDNTLSALVRHADYGCPIYCKPLPGANCAVAVDETAIGSGTWSKPSADTWKWNTSEEVAEAIAESNLLSPQLLAKIRASAPTKFANSIAGEDVPPVGSKKPSKTPKDQKP